MANGLKRGYLQFHEGQVSLGLLVMTIMTASVVSGSMPPHSIGSGREVGLPHLLLGFQRCLAGGSPWEQDARLDWHLV